MRREPDFFGEGEELELLYVAKRLKEAMALEQTLTENLVDYLVEPDAYTGGVIFRTERIGAFFYVLPGDLDRARAILTRNGYKPSEF
ncbi:MAG: hypothetical protein KIT09_34625 [Bryobacteraceae bacterium]|nr:hypothetical protein [Bryobacteraceae bacterium]